jgi:hypothetical protein
MSVTAHHRRTRHENGRQLSPPAPHQTTTDHTIPDPTQPQQTAPDQTLPDRATP